VLPEKGKSMMFENMAKILDHVRNERGAEMGWKWIVVVAVLAVVALAVFGPNGVLQNGAGRGGVNTIANSLNQLPQAVVGRDRDRGGHAGTRPVAGAQRIRRVTGAGIRSSAFGPLSNL